MYHAVDLPIVKQSTLFTILSLRQYRSAVCHAIPKFSEISRVETGLGELSLMYFKILLSIPFLVKLA